MHGSQLQKGKQHLSKALLFTRMGKNEKLKKILNLCIIAIAVVLCGACSVQERGAEPDFWWPVWVLIVAGISLFGHIYYMSRKARGALEREREDFRIAAKQSGTFLICYDVKRDRVRHFYDPTEAFSTIQYHAPFSHMLIKSGLIHPDSLQVCNDFGAAIREGKPEGSADLRIRKKDGFYTWCHVRYTLVCDAKGAPDYAIITFFDNTETREQELAYEKWLHTVDAMRTGADIYLEVNLTKNLVERETGAAAEIADKPNFTLTSFVGYELEHNVLHQDAAKFREFFWQERLLALCCRGVFEDTLEYRIVTGGKEPVWYRVCAQMAKYPRSGDVKAFITFVNIQREREEREGLEDMANRDSMTGLLNHDALKKLVQERLAAAPDELCALFMIDLDHFKMVNDRLGHQQGDQTIQDAAAAISSAFRSSDVVGRVGGDEFMAFLCGGISPQRIEEKAAEICQATQFVVDDIPISATVGVAVCEVCEADFETLYQVSDKAMYSAKDIQRGSYIIQNLGSGTRLIAHRDNKRQTGHFVQLQALLQYMDCGVVLVEVGREIRPLYISPGLYKVLGREKREPITPVNLLWDEDREEMLKRIRVTAQDGMMMDCVFRMKTPDGPTWLHVRATRIPYRDSQNPVLIAIITELTTSQEQKVEASRTLERSQIAQLQADVYVWEVDVSTRRLTQSPALAQRNGYPQLQLDNVPDSMLQFNFVHPRSIAAHKELFEAIYRGDPQGNAVLYERLADGHYAWARYSFSMLYDEGNRPLRAVGTMEPLPDINMDQELMEQEERLRAAIRHMRYANYKFNLTRDQTLEVEAPGDHRYVAFQHSTYTKLFEIGARHAVGEEDRQIYMGKLSPSALLTAFKRGERCIYADYRIYDADGYIHWVCNAVDLIREPDSGDVIGYGYLRNVDRRRRWELALPEKARRDVISDLYTRDTTQALINHILIEPRPEGAFCAMLAIELVGLDKLKSELSFYTAAKTLFYMSWLIRILVDADKVVGSPEEGRITVFLAEVDSQAGAEKYAQRLAEQLMTVRGTLRQHENIGVEIGVAVAPCSSANFGNLYSMALANLEKKQE